MLYFTTEHTYSNTEGNGSFNSNMSSGYVEDEKCILCAHAAHNSAYNNTVNNALYLKIPWRIQSIWQSHSNTEIKYNESQVNCKK